MEQPFIPTDEQFDRHSRWLDEYAEDVVTNLVSTGQLSPDGQTEVSEIVRRDMSVTSRPNWMHPLMALATVVAASGDLIADPGERLDMQDATRTLTAMSYAERAALIAEAMGVSVATAMTYDPTRTVKYNLDLEGRTCLYRHYDASNVLLYVGIAKSPKARLACHRSTGSRWVPYAVREEQQWLDTRDEALHAERVAIANERPIFNMSGSLLMDEAADKYMANRSRTAEAMV